MKHWVNFSHGEYDQERERTYITIWKKVFEGKKDIYWKTRLYSFPWDNISTIEKISYCFMSDLRLSNSGQLQFVYNFACKSGKTLHQYGDYYNDFADSCGMYSSGNYQSYFGFHDNFVAYDGIGDYIEWVDQSEEFHKLFFEKLQLRVNLGSTYSMAWNESGAKARRAIFGDNATPDDYSNETERINQDNLRVYPSLYDLSHIYFTRNGIKD